jgi:uncharacterized spore protein YtfJ
MGAEDVLQKIGQTLGSTANVRAVFGEPVQAAGKTVVPVAKVAYGFGGGFGSGHGRHGAGGERPEGREGEAGGGGGGVRAFPAGALEITESGARFVPFTDTRALGLAFAAGMLLGALAFARRRRV